MPPIVEPTECHELTIKPLLALTDTLTKQESPKKPWPLNLTLPCWANNFIDPTAEGQSYKHVSYNKLCHTISQEAPQTTETTSREYQRQ